MYLLLNMLVFQPAMLGTTRGYLGGGFKYFLFSALPGEDSHFDSYFSDGLKPPTRYRICFQKIPGSTAAAALDNGILGLKNLDEKWGVLLRGRGRGSENFRHTWVVS